MKESNDFLEATLADQVTPEELHALHGKPQERSSTSSTPPRSARQELPTLSRVQRYKREKRPLWKRWFGR